MEKLILSIETSSKNCTVALHNAGKLLLQENCAAVNMHSMLLPKLVQNIFDKTKYTEEQLVAVAVNEGPGSYTGLRVGISFAKGLAFGLDIPVININTPEILFTNRPLTKENIFWVMLIETENKNCFGTILDYKGSPLTPMKNLPVEKKSFEKWLLKKPCFFMGTGSTAHAAKISTWPNCSVLTNFYPTAAHMGKPACQAFEKKCFLALNNISPLYFTKPQLHTY